MTGHYSLRLIQVFSIIAIVLLSPIKPVSPLTLVHVPSRSISLPGLPCLTTTQADTSTAQIQATAQNVTLSGHVVKNVLNGKAREKGAMPDSANLHLDLVFKLRNQAAFQQCLASLSDPNSPNYRHFLNSSTLRPYVPTPGQKQSVTAFLEEQGFNVTNGASPIVLQLTGKVSTINRAFGTHLELYQQGSSLFYSPASDPNMPQSLGVLVNGITGLDNFTVIRPAEAPCGPQSTSPYAVWQYCPSALQVGYGFNNLNGNNGAGQTVAVVEIPGDPNIQTAINTYTAVSYYGLPSITLNVQYPYGTPTSWNPAWATETAMDVEAVHSLAPGANIVVVYDPTGNLMNDIDYVAANNLAQIVSNSWDYACPSGSSCSDTELNSTGAPGFISNVDSRLAVDTATGLTILFASGDVGSYPDGSTLGTVFPASDPNVLAVGATNLVLTGCGLITCTGYGSESGAPISGGGYSGYFSEPSWQTPLIGSAVDPTAGRAVPDVSILGYSPGFWVYSTASNQCGTVETASAGWFACSGTSLSTPLWAGFLAVGLQVRGGGYFGNVAPLLYQIAQGPSYSTDFHDITTGSNGYYSAGPGWDPVTGLGTPVANKLAPNLSPVVVTTNTNVYYEGGTVQFTGTGLTAGGSVLACFSTDNALTLVCVSTSPANDLGQVTASVQVGTALPPPPTNVPAGPQKFSIQDVATGRFSNQVQLLILGTPTTITMTSSASSNNLGTTMTFSGSIAPNPGVVPVTISVSINAGTTWSILMAIQTNSSGAYSATWTPPYAGSYSYQASWGGDSQLAGATSSVSPWAITGTPAPSILVLLTAPATASQGQSVTLSVTVFNPTSISIAMSATVQVTGPSNYLLYDLVPVNATATSDTTAYYTWTVPNQAGTYTVTVGLLPTGPSAFDTANIVVS